ncbi:MAG TPA: hypothetical protein VHQ22_15905 [Terriglobales bacterium]|jgi:hypothetical protein|nr:hypothetical protein [Terriglobales bacterium]
MAADLLKELKAQRDLLQSVIDILSKPTKRGYRRRGRRKLSAAAKKRISKAMKERWAQRKAAAKA